MLQSIAWITGLTLVFAPWPSTGTVDWPDSSTSVPDSCPRLVPVSVYPSGARTRWQPHPVVALLGQPQVPLGVPAA
jgi:hypothetical protein